MLFECSGQRFAPTNGGSRQQRQANNAMPIHSTIDPPRCLIPSSAILSIGAPDYQDHGFAGMLIEYRRSLEPQFSGFSRNIAQPSAGYFLSNLWLPSANPMHYSLCDLELRQTKAAHGPHRPSPDCLGAVTRCPTTAHLGQFFQLHRHRTGTGDSKCRGYPIGPKTPREISNSSVLCRQSGRRGRMLMQ